MLLLHGISNSSVIAIRAVGATACKLWCTADTPISVMPSVTESPYSMSAIQRIRSRSTFFRVHPTRAHCTFGSGCTRSKADQLEAHPVFGPRLNNKKREPIATIAEIKAAGIEISLNPNEFGIPQGTPISSVFSNLYLMDFDRSLIDACALAGGLYQRYSDDILVICPVGKEAELTNIVTKSLADHRLTLAADKTDEQLFDPKSPTVFQYLGFNVSADGAVIRPSSLARQWRKIKRSINKTRRVGMAAILPGKANKIFVSKLRQRFSPVGSRNFSKYARRAGEAFGSKKIVRQISRLERKADAAIRALQKP
jgi:RNA-directed DNA polymerase